MGEFAKPASEVRGLEVADDLSYWSAEITEKVIAKAFIRVSLEYTRTY